MPFPALRSEVAMRATNLMTANPAVIAADDSIPKAAQLMRNLDVGMLPVVDDLNTRRLMGVITDRDIVVRCLADHGTQHCAVREHMSSTPLVFVYEDTPIEEIGEQMERFRIRRMPVATPDMRVVGVVTQTDIVRRVGHDHPQLVQEILERIATPGALTH
jgi:CBS domain-containing protein